MSYSHNDVSLIVEAVLGLVDDGIMDYEGYDPAFRVYLLSRTGQPVKETDRRLAQLCQLIKRRAPVRDVMALVNLLTLERRTR